MPFIGLLTIALFLSAWIINPTAEATERFEENARLQVAFGRAIAFLMGAGFSLMVGQIGMRMAVEANVRVAQASRTTFGGALQIAYRAGTITGMLSARRLLRPYRSLAPILLMSAWWTRRRWLTVSACRSR